MDEWVHNYDELPCVPIECKRKYSIDYSAYEMEIRIGLSQILKSFILLDPLVWRRGCANLFSSFFSIEEAGVTREEVGEPFFCLIDSDFSPFAYSPLYITSVASYVIHS